MARALNGRSNLYNAAARAKARKASLIDPTRMRQLVQQGTDSIGDVTIRIESNGRIYTGRGSSTDIMVASAKAYLNALNKLMSIEGTPIQ